MSWRPVNAKQLSRSMVDKGYFACIFRMLLMHPGMISTHTIA